MPEISLCDALGEDGVVELVRRQRATAIRYGEFEVAARQTAWLVEHGYEKPATNGGGEPS